ncbi:hypothetical protein ACNOYE_15560 [Nannocystaceae bacterium ST9]
MITRRIDWLARQMYSRARPIGREQIFAGFAAALAELTGEPASAPELIAHEEVSGAEFLGYWAQHQTWRIRSGTLAWVCRIDPILASMGVSGEEHQWACEGLSAGVVVRGAALSSGRSFSHARLELEGLSADQAEALSARFAAAFPPIMTDAELTAELGPG